ncbi:hypothetical protein [Mycobacteroides chelonae]|uniref:Lipoprotein n=1 Tax=Mycobacteroides chelonae TaxID=1774 RepID=A0AB73M735_MYCCH|nr:hypothetical protein [Mycobacteroides chelonae]OHT55469.1 hypothetical protein BKG62_04865 [Mycobacteroides chelonae]OHT58757.1 hypothetical protein BKG64_19125 [Mycobacteroides chelonae]OHT64957.1 hypothetical protein BKG65_10260 [Mycobacteroides chelonae]OHU67655.1 hypothetical protein BKG87_23740 [Mycobacteroides chelonae]
MLRTCTLASVIALVLAGCTPHRDDADTTLNGPSQPPIPFTGLTQDMRIRWSAEPGIDLLTGPAVIIRAYRESYILGGLMASPSYYYPGFERAVPPNNPGSNMAVRPLIAGDAELASSGFQTTAPIVGTWRQHLLALTGDPSSGYTAIVCDWSYATAVQQSDNQYRYPHRLPPEPFDTATPVTGTLPVRITLTPPPSAEAGHTAIRQRGDAPSPAADVFGGWKIRSAIHLPTEFYPDEPNDWPKAQYGRDQLACRDKAPDSYEKRKVYLTGEHPRSDYPTLPADPGWPTAGT